MSFSWTFGDKLFPDDFLVVLLHLVKALWEEIVFYYREIAHYLRHFSYFVIICRSSRIFLISSRNALSSLYVQFECHPVQSFILKLYLSSIATANSRLSRVVTDTVREHVTFVAWDVGGWLTILRCDKIFGLRIKIQLPLIVDLFKTSLFELDARTETGGCALHTSQWLIKTELLKVFVDIRLSAKRRRFWDHGTWCLVFIIWWTPREIESNVLSVNFPCL